MSDIFKSISSYGAGAKKKFTIITGTKSRAVLKLALMNFRCFSIRTLLDILRRTFWSRKEVYLNLLELLNAFKSALNHKFTLLERLHGGRIHYK